MKLRFALLALAILPLPALAENDENQARFYIAGGSGPFGPAFSLGAGTRLDVIELNYIDLGKVNGGTAKFVGVSLVQNATPRSGFNFLFRIGLGRETTSFPNGTVAHRMWFNNGVYFGLGVQYQAATHLALRAEVNRIVHAVSPDGVAGGIRYPATLSAMYLF